MFLSDNLYVSAKEHKPFKNVLPPIRHILSSIGTPTYKLVKFLVPILSDNTQNEFSVQYSFTNEILTQDSDLNMASLGVDSLLTTSLPSLHKIKLLIFA